MDTAVVRLYLNNLLAISAADLSVGKSRALTEFLFLLIALAQLQPVTMKYCSLCFSAALQISIFHSMRVAKFSSQVSLVPPFCR